MNVEEILYIKMDYVSSVTQRDKMNQKDYKAIAEIMRFEMVEWRTQNQKEILKRIVDNLADYFEREFKEKSHPKSLARFDRKQFLKMAGVE